MDLQYKKTNPARLRDIGKDEQWLHDRIIEDPSILKLGDLNIIRHERTQPTKGRFDFLMYDPEDGIIELRISKGTMCYSLQGNPLA